ncbi:MAG: ABC transporter substrate-binding protein [bacterium]
MIMCRSLCLWSGLAALLIGVSRPVLSTREPRSFFYSGSIPLAEPRPNPLQGSKPIEVVKVGLLIPKKGVRAGQGLAAKQGAEMATIEANRSRGFGGRPFKLIVRSDEGPWGSGSKEIVKLVFEDRVRAILGSLDGRSAHLAEQIVTKGRVVLLSPWASDPTLTQSKIPWFFRCVPDDRQQAVVLVREVFQTRRLKRVATVAEGTYDAHMAAATFAKIAASVGYGLTLQLSYRAADHDFHDLFSQIEHANIEGVVLFGQPSPTATLVQQMRALGMKQALFGPLSLANDEFLRLAGTCLERAVLVAPGHWRTAEGKSFRRDFQNIYGCQPSAVAAYAYDGMRLIIEAIRRVGLDRKKIRDTLATTDYLQGVTGTIRFDASGNRAGSVGLTEIIKGRPSFLQATSF